MKRRLLVYIDHFLPSTAYGGPVGSVRNLAHALREDYDIEIVTRDSVFRSGERYTHEQMEATRQEVGVAIRYLPSGRRLPFALARHLAQRVGGTSIVYLNSLLSRKFSLLPLLLLKAFAYRGAVVIATRGELAAGVLSINPIRKRIFLTAARILGSFSALRFHATTEAERDDIARAFPNATVSIARVIAEQSPAKTSLRLAGALGGVLRIAVVARVSPVKNHRFLFDLINRVPGRIHLDIAGILDDLDYWRQCEQALEALPARITYTQLGVVDAKERTTLLETSHLFVLPTLGESYGHAIGEALDAGCPAIISDRTPWQGLAAAGAGAVLPLDAPDEWVSAITTVRNMTDDAYAEMRVRAKIFRATMFPAEIAIAEHRAMFAAAMQAT